MRLRRTAFNLVLTLASLAVALLAVEGVLRVWNPFDYRIKGDRIVLPVNNVYEVRVEGGNGLDPVVRHRRNGLGFRGPEPPADFDEAVTVLAVGGSTTESFYISQGRSWPELLGSRMAGVLDPVWMNNAGLDGHSTFGHLVLLEDHIARLQPDIVVFLAGWNDQRRETPGNPDRRNLRGAEAAGSLREWVYAIANDSEVAGLALNLYRSYKTRQMGLGHAVTEFDWDAEIGVADAPADVRAALLETHRDRYIPGYRARLRRLVEISRANGIRPVFLTQPAVFGGGRDARTGIDLSRMVSADINGALSWAVLELYNDATRLVARETGVPLVDVARDMPKDSTYFYDPIHFNNAGSRLVAGIVFRELCPWLLAEFPERRTAACP